MIAATSDRVIAVCPHVRCLSVGEGRSGRRESIRRRCPRSPPAEKPVRQTHVPTDERVDP
jgi:hypothetical protein